MMMSSEALQVTDVAGAALASAPWCMCQARQLLLLAAGSRAPLGESCCMCALAHPGKVAPSVHVGTGAAQTAGPAGPLSASASHPFIGLLVLKASAGCRQHGRRCTGGAAGSQKSSAVPLNMIELGRPGAEPARGRLTGCACFAVTLTARGSWDASASSSAGTFCHGMLPDTLLTFPAFPLAHISSRGLVSPHAAWRWPAGCCI
jgi:hypothetical protein